MWDIVSYVVTFLAGLVAGGIVAYIKTSRMYLRLSRSRYD